jgi:hypothetical protein
MNIFTPINIYKMKIITIVLLVLSVILMSMGGLSDLLGRSLLLSKEHYWNDGMYVVLVALLFQLSN